MLIVSRCQKGSSSASVKSIAMIDGHWSEVWMTRLLWEPRVWWWWFILWVKDATLGGNILFVSLNESHLMRPNALLEEIIDFQCIQKEGLHGKWESRWAPYMIRRKHFCKRRIRSLNLRFWNDRVLFLLQLWKLLKQFYKITSYRSLKICKLRNWNQ